MDPPLQLLQMCIRVGINGREGQTRKEPVRTEGEKDNRRKRKGRCNRKRSVEG